MKRKTLFEAESIVSAAWSSGTLVPADLFSSWDADTSLAPSAPFVLAAFDEVGRGCLAGPVVAGCTLWTPGVPSKPLAAFLAEVDDSKRLSEVRRKRIFEAARELLPLRVVLDCPEGGERHGAASPTPHLVKPHRPPRDFDTLARCRKARGFVCVAAGVGQASAREIDASNIWQAVQLAMARAFHHAFQLAGGPTGGAWPSAVVVDGKTPIKVPAILAGIPQVTAVGGDGRFTSIGLASVLAKVARDAHMVALARRHPAYGFEKHKGYGTPEHLEALRAHAPIPPHRRSFLGSLA